MTKQKIELGDTVKEKVTGFKGIAVCRLKWIAGCDFIRIQPPVNKEGVVPEARDFDEPLIEIVKKATPKGAI